MITQDKINWKALGGGYISPPGSISDKKLAERITAYKNQVAGRYRSISPQEIFKTIPVGEYIVSPKIDGETWFLSTGNGEAWLLSPAGKIITGIPLTDEATRIFRKKEILLAGELYANGQPIRPRVHDLHAALGGGAEAQTDRLHFAAFDLLEDNGLHPFSKRVQRLTKLLPAGKSCHSVPFEKISNPQGVLEAYERLVTQQGHEGIVVCSTDGQIFRTKRLRRIKNIVLGVITAQARIQKKSTNWIPAFAGITLLSL